ncbi:MAG: ABC transporter permease, partial [Bacteroidales bacterium]
MIRNFFITAFRFFIRHRLFTFMNVLGLAVSIALFILISLYVGTVLQTDRFHENADRIYRLERPQIHNIAGPFGPFILEHFPEVKNYVRMCEGTIPSRLLGYEQKHIKLEHLWLADRSFFDMFSFPLEATSGNVFEAPDRIVISRSVAEKLFGTENPVGKQVMVDNRYSLQVDGVMEDPPVNSSIRADAVIPMQYITTLFNDPQWLESFMRWNYNMLLQLKPGTDPEALVDKINGELYDFLSRNMDIPENEKPEFILTPLDQIYFNSYVSYDGFQHGNKAHVYVAMGIALVILLLAVVNFVNLSTAQSTEKTLDIGLRKTLGASGRHLMIQHLAESVLITFLSTLLALALVNLAMPFFSSLVRMELSLWPVRPWGVVLLVAGPVLLGVLAGLYPAFYLRRFPPLRIMSTGETPGSGGAIFRKVLILMQFTAAIALIIFTLHVEKQVRYMNSRDLGFSRENKFVLETSPALKENRSAFLHELYSHPGVVATSFHGYPVGRIDEKWSMENGEMYVSFRVQSADSAY